MISDKEKLELASEWTVWKNPKRSECYKIEKLFQDDGRCFFILCDTFYGLIGKNTFEKSYICFFYPVPEKIRKSPDMCYETWDEAYARWEEFHARFPQGCFDGGEYQTYLQQLFSREGILS